MKRRPISAPPPRIYRVDFRSQQTYEAGALLLTLLAFPNETADEGRFADLYLSMCSRALLDRARTGEAWAFDHQLIKPFHMAAPESVIQKDLRSLRRRLRDRMIAGRIANAIIFEAAGLDPKLPKGCEGFSIKQLIRMALDDLEAFDDREHLEAENAEQRIWRDGLAVVHLAAATQAFLYEPERSSRDVSEGDILWDAEAISWIVKRTAETYSLMAEHPERFASRRAPIVIELYE